MNGDVHPEGARRPRSSNRIRSFAFDVTVSNKGSTVASYTCSMRERGNRRVKAAAAAAAYSGRGLSGRVLAVVSAMFSEVSSGSSHPAASCRGTPHAVIEYNVPAHSCMHTPTAKETQRWCTPRHAAGASVMERTRRIIPPPAPPRVVIAWSCTPGRGDKRRVRESRPMCLLIVYL